MREELRADERFVRTLRGEETDRMPVIENSIWWDETIRRWEKEGLSVTKNYAYDMRDVIALQEHFGLDLLAHWWTKPYTEETPIPSVFGAGMGAADMESYEKVLLPTLYPEMRMSEDFLAMIRRRKGGGNLVLELIINGPFWEPREYMGIEPHLYAFYDQPELYDRMVDDMKRWQKRTVEYALNTLPFDYITVAEDMSYNNGPMLGKELFDRFIAPYYREMVPFLKKSGLPVLVDSDGNIGEAIGWYNEVGIDGYHPLEAQAGCDVNDLSARYPTTAFIGNFNKMIMSDGEAALRREFERLLPCIRRGRYVVSVDHQTPPSVSAEEYRLYSSLLREYARKKD